MSSQASRDFHSRVKYIDIYVHTGFTVAKRLISCSVKKTKIWQGTQTVLGLSSRGLMPDHY